MTLSADWEPTLLVVMLDTTVTGDYALTIDDGHGLTLIGATLDVDVTMGGVLAVGGNSSYDTTSTISGVLTTATTSAIVVGFDSDTLLAAHDSIFSILSPLLKSLTFVDGELILTNSGGFTNNGAITLCAVADTGSTLTVTTGSFTNAGTIHSEAGAHCTWKYANFLNGYLYNGGSLTVDGYWLTINAGTTYSSCYVTNGPDLYDHGGRRRGIGDRRIPHFQLRGHRRRGIW